MSSLRFVQNGASVLILADGKLVTEVPCDAALQAANALHSVAKNAEEWSQAERIAMDQALLLRTGAPIGFSSNPKIIDESIKQAAWNRDLRRYLPGGIKSREVFGRPSIIRHEPRGEKCQSNN